MVVRLTKTAVQRLVAWLGAVFAKPKKHEPMECIEDGEVK